MAVKKTKLAASAAKSVSKAKSAEAPSRKPAAKSKTTAAKLAKAPAKAAAKSTSPAKKGATAAKKTPAKAKASAAKSKKRKPKAEAEAAHRIEEPLLDPIGDVTSGEGRMYLGEKEQPQGEPRTEADAFLQETHVDASDADVEAGPGMQAARTAKLARARGKAEEKARAGVRRTETDSPKLEIEEAEEAEPAAPSRESSREPAKLERLQKILSQAGVASRRTAEEMIVAGRVIVNGKVVTELGSKADPARDHIRVDGKLLHGAERHRYFMLNKPRGYMTTVSDPEGRPTVMEFFAGARERVYPVGRLDYLSEGLLLMTNDGELANLLTKAGSGVEKTYLVKVAGQPTEEQIERLRAGVAIEKGEPGSERVRTAPARIRPFREGDNPWFEVVLIEGRNRELRKMFSVVGHYAEKIRRVGYGPLVLDLEPGNMRELTEDEVKALRLAAEGKLKPRRAKAGQMLPKEAGVPSEQRGGKSFDRPPSREFDRSSQREAAQSGDRGDRGDRRPPRAEARGEKPRWKQEERGVKREWRPRSEESSGQKRFAGASRPPFKPRGDRPQFHSGPRPESGGNRFGSAPRPPFKPRSDRPEPRSGPRQERSENRFGSAPRPPFKPRGDRPEFRGGPRPERSENRFGSAPRPPFKPRGDRPEFRSGPRPERSENRFGGAPRPPFKPRGDRPQWKGTGEARSSETRSSGTRPRPERTKPFEGSRGAGFARSGSFSRDKAKPAFGSKPAFRGKPGGTGGFRPKSGGAKRSFSRSNSQRGGGKRG